MAAPPKADILKRIRELLDEEVEGYWKDEYLLGLYDQGARKQHRIVFLAAEATGALRRGEHDYLRTFFSSSSASTVDGTQDYAIPADMYKLKTVTFVPFADQPALKVLARFADWTDDHLIRTSPQFGPTADEPVVTIRPDNKFLFYVDGNGTVPNRVIAYTVYYWRDVVATDTTTLVDVPEPWNEGPIFYAAAIALGKERSEMTPYMTLFDQHAASIIPMPKEAAS